jgi:hypothetical protein
MRCNRLPTLSSITGSPVGRNPSCPVPKSVMRGGVVSTRTVWLEVKAKPRLLRASLTRIDAWFRAPPLPLDPPLPPVLLVVPPPAVLLPLLVLPKPELELELPLREPSALSPATQAPPDVEQVFRLLHQCSPAAQIGRTATTHTRGVDTSPLLLVDE